VLAVNHGDGLLLSHFDLRPDTIAAMLKRRVPAALVESRWR